MPSVLIKGKCSHFRVCLLSVLCSLYCDAHTPTVWQVLALIQKLLLEGKVATQREAYYCLVQYFKNQGEFNDTLQGEVDSLCVSVCL